MQRHKSAEKAARQNVKSRLINRELRSRLKAAIKSVLEAKDVKTAQEALKKAYSVLDKSVKINLIHANNAANKKSRLTKAIKKLAK